MKCMRFAQISTIVATILACSAVLISCKHPSRVEVNAVALLKELEDARKSDASSPLSSHPERSRFDITEDIRMLPVEADPILASALNNPTYRARSDLAIALDWRNTPEIKRALMNALHDSDFELRVRAATSLATVPDDEFLTAIEKLALSIDNMDRQLAVRTMGMIDGVRPRAAIFAALKDASAPVRRMAISQLRYFPGKDTDDILIVLLNDPSRDVSLNAAEVLCEVSPNNPQIPTIFQRYGKLLASNDPKERGLAWNFMTFCHHPLAAPYLLKMLKVVTDRYERTHIVQALGYCPNNRDAITTLIGRLSLADPWERHVAIEALGQAKAEQAVPYLINLTRSDVFSDVSTSTGALREINSPRARGAMLELIRSSEVVVSTYAALYLDSNGSKDDVLKPGLDRLALQASMPNAIDREMAAKYLRQFKSEAAKKILKRLESDPSPHVRETALRGSWQPRELTFYFQRE